MSMMLLSLEHTQLLLWRVYCWAGPRTRTNGGHLARDRKLSPRRYILDTYIPQARIFRIQDEHDTSHWKVEGFGRYIPRQLRRKGSLHAHKCRHWTLKVQ